MHRIRVGFIGLTCTMLVVVGSANAGHMRCSTYLIEDGYKNGHSKYEILKKCGEPTERYGNTWIYNGSSRFKITMRFNADGSLHRIED